MKPCKKCGSSEWNKKGDCLPCQRAYWKDYRERRARGLIPAGKNVADQERIALLNWLRNEQGLTLKAIANMEGLSPERVRQIIGNTGREPSKQRPSPADKPTGIGQQWKWFLASELQKHGISYEFALQRRPYSMVINGVYRIAVRTSEYHAPIGKGINRFYRFEPINIERTTVDFYILVGEPGEIFIVPSAVIPAEKSDITLRWPTARPTLGKYQQYHNRFDLLRADQ